VAESTLLAVDTSTHWCSVALRREGKTYVQSQSVTGRHSTVLFEQLKQVFLESGTDIRGVDGVLYSAGPGSYTGLRVGASALKGLLFARPGVSFRSVSTLAAIAAGVRTAHEVTVHALIDARRRHAYHQMFRLREGRLQAVCEPAIRELSAIDPMIQQGHHVAGTGLSRLSPAALELAEVQPEADFSAEGLLRVYTMDPQGTFWRRDDIGSFEPDYMSGSTWNHAR